jgi:ribosomal protein S12 methylthiotransferase
MAQAGKSGRPRVALITLGCAKNVVDSERIASLLEAAGVEVSAEPQGAAVAIVNTCGFIDSAKEESINTILAVADGKRKGGLRALIVAGCLSQRYGRQLKRGLPEADVLVGVDPVGAAAAALEALGLPSPPCALPSGGRSRRLTPAAWAYLKISEGCDNRCAYCAIPLIRGPLASRPLQEVLDEARALIEQGAVELNLIAQDTAAYGMDRPGGPRLHELLVRLCALDGAQWVRLLYAHPAHFYPELIEVLAGREQVCPYLDVPLQHISDRCLKRMGRKVRRADVERLIDTLRRRIPGVTLRTTFLVGFPGETDEEFREVLEFMQAVRFDRLGAFAYSREGGTAAARLKGQVPEEVKLERYHLLMSAQHEIACERAAERVGERTRVLIESAAPPAGGPACGRSPREAPDVDPLILLPDAPTARVGDMLDVQIVGSEGYDCIARPAPRRRRRGAGR